MAEGTTGMWNMPGGATDSSAPVVTVVLRRGDALFVPSGWWTETAAAASGGDESTACELQWRYPLNIPDSVHEALSRVAARARDR